MMNANLLVGPHLIGLVMFLTALLMKLYPPKNINGLYGYRTPQSMQNQRNWDEANKYSANLMLKLSAAIIILGIILLLVLPPRKPQVMLPATVASIVIIIAILITATERHLKNLPDENPQ